MDVLVFKTTVRQKSDVRKLANNLDQLVLGKWNFDLEDCDNILRIEHSGQKLVPQIIAQLTSLGYACEEL